MAKFVVAAPPATPPRYSLLTVATEITNADRWQMGVEWTPEQRAEGNVLAAGCVASPALTIASNPGLRDSMAFIAYATDRCSALGFNSRDYVGRARRQLVATQSYQIAKEFEKGALSQAASPVLGNDWLTKTPTVVGAAAQDVVSALGQIQHALGVLLGGAVGTIEVSPSILTALVAARAIEMSGNIWLDSLGNKIASDAGFTGAKPDSGESGSTHQWMYGTGLVQYRLDDIEVIPGDMSEAVDRATNTVTVAAQRAALLQWDAGVVATETNIPAYS